MGNSSSQLKVPLVAQLKPLRCSRSSYVSSSPSSLCVDLTGMNTTFRIRDAHSGGVIHDIQPKEGSSRRTVCSANGVPLLTIKRKSGQNAYDVFDGTDVHAEPLFTLVASRKIGCALVVYAEFNDRTNSTTQGEKCRVFIEGGEKDRVVLAYLERGEKLTPLQKDKNDRNPKAVPVGRIRRPKADGVVFSEREKAFIEAEAGVDLTLLSLLWYVRYEIYYADLILHASGLTKEFAEGELIINATSNDNANQK